MNMMKAFVPTLLLIFSCFLTVNLACASSTGLSVVTISKSSASSHQAGQILQGQIGNSLPGKPIEITLPTNKRFNQLEKGDLLLTQGVIHKIKQTQQQSDGSFKLELLSTKLMIDEEHKLK